MKNKFITFLIIFFLGILTFFGQIPPGYYDPADGLYGTQLKTALYNIIKNHTIVSYNSLYTHYRTTDNLKGDTVWDMYSLRSNGTANYYYRHGLNTCGSYNSEGDCYNREHSTPASWFNDASPMYTDLFNVYPTDGYVNNRRSNYPMAKVGSATWTSSNGSKLGTCITPGYSGTVFEPIDSFKGDFARTFLYMATRYENVVASWPSNSTEAAAVYAGNNGLTFKQWYIYLLLQWCQIDPVSQKEIDRNNAVYAIQNNRNPFIDRPEFAELIWGTNPATVEITKENTINIYTNPDKSVVYLNINETSNSKKVICMYDIRGRKIFSLDILTNPTELNISSLENGVYLLTILSSNKRKLTYKIIK